MNFAARISRGFTLIEVTLTIVIISVGLFGMMFLFDNLTKGAMEGDMNITATFLNREKLEQLMFDKVYKGYDYVAINNYSASEPVMVSNSHYIRELDIYEVAKSDLTTLQVGSGFKRIDVSVKWGDGPSQKVELSTLITR